MGTFLLERIKLAEFLFQLYIFPIFLIVVGKGSENCNDVCDKSHQSKGKTEY